MNNILELNNVSKFYKNPGSDLCIFKDVDFNVEQGKIYALTGVSGSGKTTFLNLVGGFDNVSSGKILLNNINITDKNEEQLAEIRNKNLGYIFQSFYLIPELNVIENVILPGLKMGIDKKNAIKRGLELLDMVGIRSKEKNTIDQISGGEAQRVAIARAMMNNPELILADEPTGNLDQDNREKVLLMLIEMVKKLNKTIIIATHNKTIADKCDEHYYIEDRNIVKIR